MSTAVVIPVRGLSDGKTRLAGVLDRSARSTLVERMLHHVLHVVLTAPFATAPVVVSGDADLLRGLQVRYPGVRGLVQHDTTGGLNAGLEQGRQWAIQQGADELMVLFADLPMLSGEDLHLLRESPTPVTIATDRSRVGTNALLLRGPETLASYPFLFGAQSRQLHVAAAERGDVSYAVVEVPGIQADLDTPDDWQRLDPALRDHLLGDRSTHDLRGDAERLAFPYLEHV